MGADLRGGEEAERRREASRRWYSQHYEECNRKRREVYSADESVRVRQQKRDVRYRKLRQRRGVSTQPRVHNGVEVLTISQVAAMAGRTRYAIEYWEGTGYLPAPTITSQSGRRLYTMRQAELVAEMSRALQQLSPAERVGPGGVRGADGSRIVARIVGKVRRGWGSGKRK